jgi:hypothetical protein
MKSGGAMKIIKVFTRSLSWVIIVSLLMPYGVMAQAPGQAEQPARFTKEELAQMLAPIALYPDSLLADVLMASTYPIEVVEAERWLKQNANLKGDELDRAMQDRTWDSSVKTLCHFPDVLYAMSDNLERTARLGDAFLGQRDDVMNTIQELRRGAQEQGNLKTTDQQKVSVDNGYVGIEPVNPQVIYVPEYDPLYVYGPWWYPAYPPYYWYYPPVGIIASGIIGFGLGIFLGVGIFSWSWFDWHHHHVDIDIYKTGRFNRFDRGRWDFNTHVWTHEQYHRRGAAYRNMTIGRGFGTPPRIPGIRPEARGYPGTGFHGRGSEPFRGAIGSPGGHEWSGGRIQRGGTQRGAITGNTFRGIGNGSFENRASERGLSSRRSSGFRAGGRSGGFSSGGRGGGVSAGGRGVGHGTGGRSGGSRR